PTVTSSPEVCEVCVCPGTRPPQPWTRKLSAHPGNPSTAPRERSGGNRNNPGERGFFATSFCLRKYRRRVGKRAGRALVIDEAASAFAHALLSDGASSAWATALAHARLATRPRCAVAHPTSLRGVQLVVARIGACAEGKRKSGERSRLPDASSFG